MSRQWRGQDVTQERHEGENYKKYENFDLEFDVGTRWLSSIIRRWKVRDYVTNVGCCNDVNHRTSSLNFDDDDNDIVDDITGADIVLDTMILHIKYVLLKCSDEMYVLHLLLRATLTITRITDTLTNAKLRYRGIVREDGQLQQRGRKRMTCLL